MQQIESFREGEIVWARVLFPHKWWPAVVVTNDSLGVFVSFFDYEKPQYFLQSEICSFEQNFASLIKNVNCSKSEALLDRALKLVGHRALNVNLFRPDEVLGFVLGVAVSPWVNEADFVEGVTCLAQITTFRRYSSTKQKSMYQNSNTPTPGACSNMWSHSSLVKEMHLVARQPHALGLIDGCQEFYEPVENKLHDDQLDIKTGTQTNQRQAQSLHEMLITLHCLALDPFYLVAECLNTVKQNFLSFRNLSYQNISDFCFKKCSPPKSSEAQISNPWYIETQLSIKSDGRKRSREMLRPFVPYMQSPVNRLSLKRQLDRSSIYDPYLKLRRTMPFSSYGANAFLQRRKTECEAGLSDAFISRNALSDPSYELCKTMPFISVNGAYSYLRRHRTKFEANLFEAFFSGCQLNLEIQNFPYIGAQSLTYLCNSGLMDLVQNMFNIFLAKHKSRHTDITEKISMVQEHKNVDTVYDYGTNISYAKMQEPEKGVSNLTDNGTCICYANDGVHTEDVKVDCNIRFLQSSNTKSEFDYVIETNAGEGEDGHSSEATRKSPLHFHIAADQIKMQHGNGDDSTSVKTNRLVSINLAFGDNCKENNESQVAQQSALASFALCKSLHMKFPKDYNLPLEKELVKKFSPFGMVDLLRTKVFSFSNSARVVFLKPLDAVAAYQYAKRKKVVFGRANVQFWLDPFEHKRRGTKFSAPFPSLTGKPDLKSCLKKSNSTEKEGKGGPRKVRFLMET